MIPIQLTIKGLYSYKEKQVINFEPLISSGLFGIFGTVGSGKSSILEAIMFVLYNTSDRLNVVGRNYNMMNLQSNEMIIDFIFHAGDQNKDRYRAYYHSKRNAKNFDDVKLKDRCFYKWENDGWMPLENVQDASLLTGLNYKNFMQTVIIPQGKFREFVDQTAASRTQMLKDIFQLENFDLSIKTNKLLHECLVNISGVEGRLQELGDVSELDIKAVSEDIKRINDHLGELKLQLQKLKQEEESLKSLKVLYEKINALSEELSILENEQEFYAQKEKQLKTYQTAYTYFREKLNTLLDVTQELKLRKDKRERLSEQLIKKNKALDLAREDYKAAKAAWNTLDDIKEKCNDLTYIIEIRQINTELEILNARWKKEKAESTKIENTLKENKARLKQHEQKYEWLNDKTSNASELNNIKNWFLRKTELALELEEANKLMLKHKQDKHRVEHDKELKVSRFNGFSAGLDYASLFQKIKSDTKNIKAKIDIVGKEIPPLQVKQRLADYAKNLSPEEPCPLCGSTHHPNVAGIESVNNDIEEKQSLIEKLKLDEKKLSNFQQELQQLYMKDERVGSLILSQQNHINHLEGKMQKHREAFNWNGYDLKRGDEIHRQLAENEKYRGELADVKKGIKTLRVCIEQVEAKKSQQEQKLLNIEHEKIRKESETGKLQKLLKRYEYDKFKNHSLEALNKSLSKGRLQISTITGQYEKCDNNLQALDREASSLKGQLEAEENILDDLIKKSERMDREIRQDAHKKGFRNIQAVQEVLGQKLDIEAEQKAIQGYRQQLHNARQAYQKLKQEAAQHKYDEARHVDLLDEIRNSEDKADALKKEMALKNREIEEFRKKIETIKKLKAELERLESRKDNLSELSSLFRGSGFVNYVSSIYLHDLCQAANHRFFKLTKNNLSLELNPNNEFMVRDYLNNGKTRLLKTLSGGQTFQAALCLALALAEQVKSLNRAKQSFFFIDEGFGALDKTSLQVVFDTLKSLRKENRIVGIISHVEELQQEIEVYLKVENDRERGSLVSCSWKM